MLKNGMEAVRLHRKTDLTNLLEVPPLNHSDHQHFVLLLICANIKLCGKIPRYWFKFLFCVQINKKKLLDHISTTLNWAINRWIIYKTQQTLHKWFSLQDQTRVLGLFEFRLENDSTKQNKKWICSLLNINIQKVNMVHNFMCHPVIYNGLPQLLTLSILCGCHWLSLYKCR